MQTIKIRNLDSTEDNTVTDNSYLALALNENDVKRESEDPNDLNSRITVKTTISQIRKAILPTIGSSPPVSENEEGGIDVGIGDVILDENGDALVPQPPVVIKQGGKDQINITDDGISLKENVVIDKSLSVTQGITTLGGINAQGTSLLSGTTTFTGLTNFGGPTTFTNPVTFNEVASDPAPTDGKIYRKSDGLYFNGSKLLTEGQGGKWVDGDSSGDIVYNGGNVGIGITDPGVKLQVVETSGGTQFEVRGTTAIGGQFQINNAGSDIYANFRGAGSNEDVVKIDTNGDSFFNGGKVCIGNTSPGDFKLNVTGKGYFNGAVQVDDMLGVGIYPTEKFHVNGTVKLDDTVAPTTTTNKLYSVSSVLYWGGNKILTAAGAGASSGGIAIADISGLETTLANKLDKPTAGSEPTFVDSDINLKTNISLIQSPIKSLESIRGVNFEWKEESNKSGEDQGLIAQEVEKIIPSAVKKGEDGYLKVDYTKLVPFLLEAVKDLSERVKELENK